MPRVTEPPDVLAADLVIGHSLEASRPYRDAAMEVMLRQEAGVSGQNTTQSPAVRPLPSAQVARHHVGKEVSRLSLQAEQLTRQAEGPFPGAFAGNTNPYLADVHRGHEAMATQARNQLAEVRAELKKLEALDDYGAQEWAYARGVR